MAFVRDKETREITDHELNAVLRSVRGYSSGHKDWEIDWNGDVIGFTAKDTRKYGGETQNIPVGIEWFIASMKIPENLKDKRSQIMEMIKNSMEAQGLGPSFEGYPSTVTFDPRLIR